MILRVAGSGGDEGGGDRHDNVNLTVSPVSAATNLGPGRRVLDHFLPKRGESHLSKGEQIPVRINHQSTQTFIM